MATKEPYASYEKTSVVTVEKITHTVRFKLNESKFSIMRTLENVPDNAKVVEMSDDSELGDYGEIVFEESIEK